MLPDRTVVLFQQPDDQLPFSLGGCFNLSELTLDMVGTHLCIATTSVDILSTLDPIRGCRLQRIRLTTSCTHRFFRKKPRTELAQTWGNLDFVLSELAKVATRGGGGLTVVLLSTGKHKEGCLASGKKWLSELLPRFRGLGSLRIGHGRSYHHRVHWGGCVYEHHT